MPGRHIDLKWSVAHAQARVAARFDVSIGPAEAPDEKVAEALFSRRKLIPGVHGAEDLVARHVSIERRDESGESLFAEDAENFIFL